jgi:hypothetical protein
MGRIRLKGLAISGMAVLALPIAALAAVLASAALPASAAETDAMPQQTLQDCQRIPDDSARLACFDRVMKSGKATMAPPATAPATTSPAAGGGSQSTGGQASAPQPPTEADQKAAFGLPPDERPDFKRSREHGPDEVEITVASVGHLAAGMVSVTSTDGAVWNQTGGGAPSHVPKPGDKVTIKRNFMGGYKCKFSRWETVRCMRVQ